MANEFRVLGVTTGSTVYAVVTRHLDELVWQTTTSSFVSRVTADQGNYDVALTETPAGAQVWRGNFPSGITDDGTVLYHVDYYVQAGGSPDADDTVIGGEDITSNGTASPAGPSTSGFVSIAEYDLIVPDSELSDSAKTFLIAEASDMMERYCGRKLLAETGRVEKLNGTGFGYLQLSAVPSAVTQVLFEYDSDVEEEISASDFDWTSTGLLYLKPDADASRFPLGFQNILVTYTTSGVASYSLKGICIDLVKKLEFRKSQNSNVTGKTVGNVKIDFRIPVYAGLEDPIFGDIASRLRPFEAIVCI